MSRLFFVIVLTILFVSCEEDFSPFGNFNEEYILTCILRADTTYQTATLSSTYFTGTTNPLDNTADPSISFADVRIWYGDSVYVLKDSVVSRIDTSRYKNPLRFYYSDRFNITYNKPIEIEVLLQNGKRLKAASITPKDIQFSNNNAVIIPPVAGDLINLFWTNGNTAYFYRPVLSIRYRVITGSGAKEEKIEVPISYRTEDNQEIPVYPAASNKTAIVYNLSTISKTLELILESNAPNEIYIYEKLDFIVSIMDENLSRYVSSTSQSFDDLTVRVNENDYTNVHGGLGIFASYINKKYDKLKFQPSYIRAFGLNFIQEN